MPISWDEEQPISIVSWLEQECPIDGTLNVYAIEVPEDAFAAEARLATKDLIICTNLNNSTSDWGLTIGMGYILAMAFDYVGWIEVPSLKVVTDCHRVACASIMEYNEEFASAIEESLDLLHDWIKHQESGTSVEVTSLVPSMGSSLFNTTNPDDDKYGAN